MVDRSINFNFFFCRDSEIQYTDADLIFHTPGVSYRPANLKSMTVLLGHSEHRKVYKNFALENLNRDNLDVTHKHYEKYLQYNYFTPPGEKNYFAHTMFNTITPNTQEYEGSVNIFPLDLESDEIKTPSTALGVVSSSPLYLELEMEPTNNNMMWFLAFTFIYKQKINFTGNKLKQDISFDYLK